MTIEKTIEKYIIKELFRGSKRKFIDYDESLIRNGILDSLAVIRLVSFLEEKYNILIDDSELTPENFQSINFIKIFLERKLA